MREAAQWTIKLLKETNPPLEEHELAILDENHEKKSNRISLRDQRSPNRQVGHSGTPSMQNYVVTNESRKNLNYDQQPQQYSYEPQETHNSNIDGGITMSVGRKSHRIAD